MTEAEFLAKWTAKKEEFARLSLTGPPAQLIDDMLADVHRVLRDRDDDLLTLAQAAQERGYTPDHLGRLIRDGQITNRGRKHAPRVRRGDLPARRERTRICADGKINYDPVADARTIWSRPSQGDSDDQANK